MSNSLPCTRLIISGGMTGLQVGVTAGSRLACPLRDIAQHLHITHTHTHRQASLIISRYTTPACPTSEAALGQPVIEAGLSTGTWRGARATKYSRSDDLLYLVPPRKRKEQERKDPPENKDPKHYSAFKV